MITKKFTSYLRSCDNMTEASCTNFKMQGDDRQKSVVGGIASLICFGFLLQIGYKSAVRVILKNEPYI